MNSKTLAAGTRLGPYEVVSPLGKGGMAEVYRSVDTTLGRSVAVKVLSGEAARDAERLRRFVAEAKAASALNHPNILTIHAIGQEGDRPYIVSELVEGTTLRALLDAGSLPLPRAIDIAVQALAGLSKAHSAGIVHRDLKPENLMVTADGLVKILDFGIALLLADPMADRASAGPEARLTETGVVMGTLAYMSPEQARGEPVDFRSDIFSLGVILHEMISGANPFRRPTDADTLAALVRDEPQPLHVEDGDPAVADELSAVIERALCKDPGQRYANAQAMAADLRGIRPMEAARQPPGLRRQAAARLLRSPATWAFLVGIVAVVAVIVMLLAGRGDIDSVAVLPFANVGGEEEAEYLSDGLTESLINTVSRLPHLKVIARSSVFSYKGREVDPRRVGRELGVRAVLMGRVVKRGDSVTISAELVDTRDGRHIWGEQYSRRLADVSGVQEEIAGEISEALHMRLTGDVKRRLARRETKSTEAYQLYLKGRYHWNKRTDEAIKKGIEYFQQAIEQDPGYALAYAGLADAYNLLGYRRTLPPRDAWLKGKAAAGRALEIDDSLAEAHIPLAFAAFNYDWDFEAAGREFRRALDLNPSYAHGHHWYSHYLTAMGRREESLAESQRAVELDPLDVAINVHVAWHNFMARQYDQAIEQCTRALEMDPDRQTAYVRLGDAYERQGRFPEAVSAFRKTNALAPENTEAIAGLAHALGVSGQEREAQKVLGELMALAERRYVSAFDVALVHLGLGEKDEAFAWLDKAREERASGLVYIKVDPRLDDLRPDPRFSELLRSVGLD